MRHKTFAVKCRKGGYNEKINPASKPIILRGIVKIPAKDLESTKMALCHLISERSSAPWATYDDDDLSQDEQDYEDIEGVESVLDVYRFLRDQGDREIFVEYATCLDPLGGFQLKDGVDPNDDDERAFRKYLQKTYKIPPSEFY